MANSLTNLATMTDVEIVLQSGMLDRNYCTAQGFIGPNQVVHLDLNNDRAFQMTALEMIAAVKASTDPFLAPTSSLMFELFNNLDGRGLDCSMTAAQGRLMADLELMCWEKAFHRVVVTVGNMNCYGSESKFVILGFPDPKDEIIFKLASYSLDAF